MHRTLEFCTRLVDERGFGRLASSARQWESLRTALSANCREARALSDSIGYHENLNMAPVTGFAALCEALQPGASGSDIAKLLDHRAERTRICHWKAGRRGAPQWAIDLLRAKLTARHARELELASRAIAGPGLAAGAKNLAAWKARQSKQNDK